MAEKLKLKKNDLQPYYYVLAEDSLGNPINLSGATIYCTMVNQDTGVIKINRQNTGISITDAVNGKFEYHWQAGDTDTIGTYSIEFEINPASGGKFTVPVKYNALVQIVAALDAT